MPSPAADSSPPLVLASSSPFRRALLERLCVPFDTAAPEVDETPLPGETPEALVQRLAKAKAAAVSAERPGAVVIGSDQVAEIDGRILGKPGGREQARRQLAAASGRSVRFLTGLCVMGPRAPAAVALVPFIVRFRTLDEARIERYLEREQPWNCAGSIRSEGLGISLFESMEGSDPTALIGLPLIRLVQMLEPQGILIP